MKAEEITGFILRSHYVEIYHNGQQTDIDLNSGSVELIKFLKSQLEEVEEENKELKERLKSTNSISSIQKSDIEEIRHRMNNRFPRF